MRKHFICIGGAVKSANDGQIHTLPPDRVAELYGVNPSACRMFSTTYVFTKAMNHGDIVPKEVAQYVILRPREDGKYRENWPYEKVPVTLETYSMARAAKRRDWTPSTERAILADALQDAGYRDDLRLDDLRSDSADIDVLPFEKMLEVETARRIASLVLNEGKDPLSLECLDYLTDLPTSKGVATVFRLINRTHDSVEINVDQLTSEAKLYTR